MNPRKLASIVGLGLSLSLVAGAVQAATWSLEDDDIDFVLNPLTLQPKTSGLLAVGDIFVSALEVPVFTINGANAIPPGQEMTGVAAVELAAIIPSGVPGGVGTTYIFAPYAGGLNSILALGTDPDPVVPGGGVGGGAAVALWLNGTSGAGGDRDLDLNRTTNPATNCVSLADCLDQASQGNLFQVDGFGLDPDEFWVAIQTAPGGNNLATVLAASNNLLISAYNLGLSNFFNVQTPVGFINIQTGLSCGNPGYILDGCVQFSASGTILGGQGLVNGAIAHSDFDGQKLVPEPSVMALLGAGLLGFGARLRKRGATK